MSGILPKILASNLELINYSQSGSAPYFPNDTSISILQDYNIYTYTTLNYLDHPSLILDFGSAHACDTLIIENHNLNSCLAGIYPIRVDAADDSAFTSGFVTVLSDITTLDDGKVSYTFSSVSKRYWRIYYNGYCLEYPRIGNIYLDKAFQFPNTMEWNYKSQNPFYNTYEKVALDGSYLTAQSYDSRNVYEFAFSLQTNTFRTSFISLLAGLSNKPFYYIDVDNTAHYVRNDNNYTPIDVAGWQYNNVSSFKMKDFGTVEILSNYSADGPFIKEGVYLA